MLLNQGLESLLIGTLGSVHPLATLKDNKGGQLLYVIFDGQLVDCVDIDLQVDRLSRIRLG
jgi:hypothetical protein